MKPFKIILFTIVNMLIVQFNLFAYRVYPTIAQNEIMFSKSNFPFIAENADGFNLQYDSFGPFSISQVETIFQQFTNKNFINHGIYQPGIPITNISTMNKMPSIANVTAFMLYNEAPAMDSVEWASALNQNTSWPLITHCRIYNETSSLDETRRQILATSGIMMEFQVTNPDRFDDAAKLLKYCVDHDRMVVFLTTFQRSPDIFVSAYKEFFYYLKENLDADYLASDQVIFVPNTYDDRQVFPETIGYGSTFGVAHWLIDQKTKVYDGYIQPEISFTSIKDEDYFPNHSDLTIAINVTKIDSISTVQLYMNDSLVGEDLVAPYTWSGGLLNDLTTGYKEIKAVITDINGIETSKAIQIRILDDPISIPGFFNASEISDYQLRNDPDTAGFIRHIYGNEWIDYDVNVEHAGLYDVKVDIKVQRSKQYGGTIILNSGKTELGRFSTITNDPNKDPLPGFIEKPNVVIKNVPLLAGKQTIRVTFSHPLGITKPQFYLYSFNFMKQGAPTISFTTPLKNEANEYGSYDAPARMKFAATVTSPREDGQVKSVSLFMNNTLVETLTELPFRWNDDENIDRLNHVAAGNYTFKIVATDELGYTSFEEIDLLVIARNPFNTNLKIPGIINAWEYDLGGEGIAYHDFNEGFERGLGGAQNPRYEIAGNEDVEIEISAGDYCVSGIRNGEWLNYTISDVEKGMYDIILTTSANTGKSANVLVWLNNSIIATVPISETGSGFTVFKDFKNQNIKIQEDLKYANIRLEFSNPDIRNYLCFFRKFEFKKTGIISSKNEKGAPLYSIYPNPANSIINVFVSDGMVADIVVRDISGRQILKRENVSNQVTFNRNELLNAGTYFVSIDFKNYGTVTQKLIIQ